MENILQLQGVTKRYGGFQALTNVTLTLGKGKIVGLLGPNGSGKTTLIKLVAGLLTPDFGSISVCGLSPGIETKSIVSYLPERTYLNDWMRVNEIIDFFADFYQDFDKVKAYEMLKRLNIEPSCKLKTLSKGTKEKVQLTLVMARNASLYLLDEPIGGVDPAARDFVMETIIGNYSGDSTVLISTHLIYDIEKMLHEFLFLNNGQIVMQSDREAVMKEHGKSVDQLFREVFRC